MDPFVRMLREDLVEDGYLSWDARISSGIILRKHILGKEVSSANVFRWIPVGKVQEMEMRPEELGHRDKSCRAS